MNSVGPNQLVHSNSLIKICTAHILLTKACYKILVTNVDSDKTDGMMICAYTVQKCQFVPVCKEVLTYLFRAIAYKQKDK